MFPARKNCVKSSLVLGIYTILLALNAGSSRAQTTITVPTNYPTIQSAINAANNGDTVLVAPGTYVESINFNGKAVTVTSSNGAAATIIDGNHNGTVVTFNHSETLSSVLSGFTIRNGFQSGGFGAGITITSASPTITSNVVTGNHAAVAIGIYVNGGSPLISNNTITSNDQTGAGDGGIGGGGIAVAGSSESAANPQIINNTITNNNVAAGGDGGGISVMYFSSPFIQGNTISGNSAYNNGGGVSLNSYNSPVLSNNLIASNSAGGGGSGGGIYLSARNSATVTVVNNTLVGNTAFDGSSGIFTTGWAQNATLTNNVVVAADNQTAITCNTFWSSVSAVFSYNDVYSSTGVAWTAPCDHTSNPGNISSDPLFIDPSGNFRLQSNSPAVDAGSNSATSLPSTDLDGSPRIVDGNGDRSAVVDLGAYELQPTTLTWTPSSLTFNPQPAGTTSAAQTISLTNTGAQKLYVSIATTAPFTETDDCGGAVAAGANCSLSIAFSPASTGGFTGAVTLRDNAPQSPQTISVSGTGGVPSVTLTPSTLSFDSQQVGTSSSAQTVKISNGGDGPLTISSIAATGDFSQTSNCAGSLAAGANCSINITFTPTAAGSRQGTLTVSDNAATNPQTVSLTGTGIAPQAVLSPTSLSFGDHYVGTTSSPQTVTLSNNGSVAIAISGISTSGDFAQTNSCGSTLAAGTSCSITVTFAPETSGNRPGTLTVSDNASGSPQTVSISGNGLLAYAVLSASYLSFGGQPVGTTSAAQTLTLSNPGSAPLLISSIVASGDFSQSNSCGSSLAAGSSCVITVTFTPAVAGTRSGSLTLTDNDAFGHPQIASLTGTGLLSQAVLSPTSISFGGQILGTTSNLQTVTLSNPGNAPLAISAITITGDFSQTNSCGNSLAASASCTINVTFRPTLAGTRQGTMALTDNASGNPQSVSLTGTGLAPQAALSPASVSFGGQAVGTTSPSQAVTLSNAGGAPLTISAISITGDFSQTNSCGTTLAAGGNCTITVTFRPNAAGTRQGILTVADNASGSPQTVSLAGTGLVPIASLSPTSLSFGSQVIGTASASQTLTLSNTGGAPLAISGIAISGDFSQSGSCGSTLAAGGSCAINITFVPSAAGARTGTLTVSSSSSGGQVTASFSGTGVQNAPSFDSTSLVFSNQNVGTKSSGKNVRLTANGPGPLAISSISVTGPFLQSNNCPASLNSGSSCNITVSFQSVVGGPASGAVFITDNGLGSPQSISLSGNGLDFTLSVSPSAVAVDAGQKTNLTTAVTEIGGTFNSSVNLACSGLPAGAKCQFSPAGITPKTGSATSSLSIQTQSGTSGTPSGAYTITITGTSGSIQRTTAVSLTVN